MGSLRDHRLRLRPVVVVAPVFIAAHVLDDALWHTPRGAAAGHALILAAPIAALLIAWVVVASLAPPPIAVALLFVVGALLAVDVALHLAHASDSGLGGSDVTGILLALPALALLLAAAATMMRPKMPRSALRRWGARLGAVVAAAAALLLVVMPLGLALSAAHKPAMDVPQAALPPGHREISLRTVDGVRVAASYVAPRNGTVIVVLHGSGGDRGGGPLSRARVLMRHGFGVMLLDAQGSGDSSGRPENLGWTWPREVRPVVDWLAARPEVDHIGALGLSTGAEALIDAAAHDPRIGAVIADGTQARQAEELRVLPASATKAFTWWELTIAQSAYRAVTHAPHPQPLDDLLRRIAPRPVLLIAASDAFERRINEAYARRAPGVQLWEPAGAGHTAGLEIHPREYERRIVDFFRNAWR